MAKYISKKIVKISSGGKNPTERTVILHEVEDDGATPAAAPEPSTVAKIFPELADNADTEDTTEDTSDE